MDEALLRSINALAAVPFLATLGVFLSSPWMVACVCVPLAFRLVQKKRWIAIVSIALAMGVSDFTNSKLVKPLIARDRPCRALEGLVEPVRCGAGRSFPSTHAANSFAFLLSAAPTVRFGWAIFTPISVAIAGSRVLLGVHYPSDVAGGALFGSIVGGLFWFGRKRVEARRTSRHPSTSR